MWEKFILRVIVSKLLEYDPIEYTWNPICIVILLMSIMENMYLPNQPRN
jgi:hypothetical protein